MEMRNLHSNLCDEIDAYHEDGYHSDDESVWYD